MTKETPILMSAPMVRATLADLKWQTRRILRREKLYGPFAFDDPRVARYCPYGQPGDRLWVRETWRGTPGTVEYRADQGGDGPLDGSADAESKNWRPSIFMPRWASRLTLKITDVRVERLQEISEADAIAEGVPFEGVAICRGNERPDPRPVFVRLWDQLNAKRGYPWSSNPWVFVITFKRVTS